MQSLPFKDRKKRVENRSEIVGRIKNPVQNFEQEVEEKRWHTAEVMGMPNE